MRFAIIFRLEKKKIIRSNIDLAEYTLKILRNVRENPRMSDDEFKALYLEKTPLEKEGKYMEWINGF